MTDWPFTAAELTAGLRRYFAEPALRVRSLAPTAADPDQAREVRGLCVSYEVGDDSFTIECVVKEPRAARRGLAHPGVREARLYRSLSSQFPMATPALIAADTAGSWLVLEAVEARAAAGGWDPPMYLQAIGLLARLHERFWNLADDLSAYPWLARPLTLDYEIHVYAAAQALGKIVRDERPSLLAQSAAVLSVLGQIVSQADQVVQPLRAVPFTLLHGDFWEGNILQDEDGDMIVLDWQLAAIGPGVLDLLVLVTNSLWERDRLPVDPADLVASYREAIARNVHVAWSDDEWARLWDHALLWRFLQEMLNWAAGARREAFAARAERFASVWLEPVLAAASRRLRQPEGNW